MKVVSLSQVVEINPRPPKGLEDSREISFVPMAAVSEDGGIDLQETRNFGEVKRGFTYFQRGDVVLAKITPCFENGKSALADNLEHPIGFGSTEFHVLRAIPGQIYPRFLYHLVRSKRLLSLGQKSMKGAAGHKRVPAEFLENFEIPDWPLDDQIRIAHLLGKVEGLIAQRKNHLQQLDDLLKSVFLDMFGDPVRNEKGWDVESCEKAVLEISSGTSYGGEDRPFENPEEIGVLKISAVTKGTFDPTEFKVVNRAQVTKALRYVKRGDFLFSRANTIQLVAACCVVPEDYDRLFLPDKLWVLTLNEHLVKPQFLNYLLKNERYRDVVRALASGGHDSMLNISMKKFMTLGIPCPPEGLQNQFAAIVEKIEALKSRYQQILTDLEALYGALSQQAFKGELDLSRVPLPTSQLDQGDSNARVELQSDIAEDRLLSLPELPSTISLSNALGRTKALQYWFDAYLVTLSPSDLFQTAKLLDAMNFRLAVMDDADHDIALDDYELVKTWTFDALRDSRLEQVRNITDTDDNGNPIFGNRIELRAVQP